jgi:hypothetical protein
MGQPGERGEKDNACSDSLVVLRAQRSVVDVMKFLHLNLQYGHPAEVFHPIQAAAVETSVAPTSAAPTRGRMRMIGSGYVSGIRMTTLPASPDR